MMRLERTAANLKQLTVAPEPLDDVLAHVAIPAEDLHRAVGDILAHRRKQLDAIGVETIARGVQIHSVGDLVEIVLPAMYSA